MTTIRTRYATHPGSNVGDILATGGGRTHRRRIDQSLNLDANHRAAAVTLAARLTIPADRVVSPWDLPAGGSVSGFTWTGLEPEPAPTREALHRSTADGRLIHPWASPESRDLQATARRMFTDHGHGRQWDRLTRENCGACALDGYGAHDDDGRAPYAPNHAAWARTYVQAGRVIPREYRAGMRRELSPDNTNTRYRDCLARDVMTFGVTFSDGGAL